MRIPGARAIRLPDRRGTKQRDSWRSPRKKSGNADPEGDEVPAWDECADEWMTLAGTMNEAGIDCDAGQGSDSIRRWNACMPDQFPASGGWAQGRGGDAMFNRLESSGLVHGAWVVDCHRSPRACGETGREKCRIALQCDWNVSPLAPDKFLASLAQNPRQAWTIWSR